MLAMLHKMKPLLQDRWPRPVVQELLHNEQKSRIVMTTRTFATHSILRPLPLPHPVQCCIYLVDPTVFLAARKQTRKSDPDMSRRVLRASWLHGNISKQGLPSDLFLVRRPPPCFLPSRRPSLYISSGGRHSPHPPRRRPRNTRTDVVAGSRSQHGQPRQQHQGRMPVRFRASAARPAPKARHPADSARRTQSRSARAATYASPSATTSRPSR